MKKISFLILLFVGCMAHTYAQVGINTTSPFATLDVTKEPSGTVADGIIAPNLSLSELIARNALYGANQSGSFVYVTAIDATPAGKTRNIIAEGYYYFDGIEWKHFNDKLQTADNGLSVGTTANVQLGGELAKDTEIKTQGHDLAITGVGNLGLGTITPSVKLDIETGGNATTPIKGFKLKDGNEGLGKVLTDDGTGTGTWAISGATSAILGTILAPTTFTAIQVPFGFVGYTGMYITLLPGYYQINFTALIQAQGDTQTTHVGGRFASVFFSYSNIVVDPITTYLSNIKSVVIPRSYNTGTDGTDINEYYGSGAIPIQILDNPLSPTNETIIYLWAFMSTPNFTSLTNNQIYSANTTPGSYGPYTQLYAIPFHIQ